MRPYANTPTPQAEARLKRVVHDVLDEFARLTTRRIHVEVETVMPTGRPLQRLEARVVLHLLEGHAEPIDDPWVMLGLIDDDAQVELDAMLGAALGRDEPVQLEIVSLITR